MKDYSNEHLVIVRTSGSIMNLTTYNCQELGLAKALLSKGLRVSLVLAGENTHKEIVGGINVFFCSFEAINQQLAWFCDINSVLTELKPTLIQVHDMGLLMTWKVVRWAKMHNVPSFLIQGNYCTTQKPFFKQFEHLYNCTLGKYVIKNVTGVGYKTLMASKYIKRYYDRPTKPTFIGLDDSKFKNPIHMDWKNKLKLNGKKVLLYVGLQEPRRNPLFLIEILKYLPDEYVLLFVGKGPSVNDVNARTKAYGLCSRVIQLGKQPQEMLPSLYGISDLFLLASNYEIYGMVILEAMYFGVPVISTLTAGSETLIDAGRDGFIIPELNACKWANTIERICKDSSVFESMKLAAIEKIKNKLMWEKSAVDFLELYFS